MNLSALDRITYGMYILSARQGERFNGQIVNTVVQVTAQPCQIAVIVNKKNLTHEYVTSSKAFSISIIEQETPLKFIGLFGFNSGRRIDKFRQAQHKTGSDGLPIVTEHAISYLECRLRQSIDAGSHTIFIGLVTNAETLKDAPPMTYAYYHDVKGGKTQENAPTYVAEAAGKEKQDMPSYRCTICGYVYDPKVGDPDAGVKPGISFESLPVDWVCPVCGAAKDKFVRVE